MHISKCSLYLQVILAFCWVYIRKYQSRQESEVISTITAICALAIALITSALLPVDIFLVSFMKYPNGTYKVTIFLYRKVVCCLNSDLCLIQPRSSIIHGLNPLFIFFIVHKQSNHKRLRALHNKWFGCLAWMLLLLVYSHHLWKQCISFLKHPIIQSNAIRREINTSGLSSQTELSTSVFYFETQMV